MKIQDLLKDYNISPRGVIHVGAFTGTEYDGYKKAGALNIIFVEPARSAFKALNDLHGTKPDVLLFNCACGARDFSGNLNVEKNKSGFYNSLLKPGTVTNKTNPNITFSDFEQVKVKRLDAIPFKRSKYNFMVITTNGYEAEVLKGAAETISNMDCIFIQAYKDGVYEGVAAAEELDKLLAPDFKRQAINWVDDIGFALYVRTADFKFEQPVVQTPEGFFVASGEGKIITVPKDLQPASQKPYIPEDNSTTFEEWYFKNLKESDLTKTDRYYLPVFWKNYYKSAAHGFDQVKMNYLQSFLDQLDKTKKYFTVVEYDDGIINDISKLDIKLFASSGNLRENDYPLPTMCLPHRTDDIIKNKRGRDLFANYPLVTNNHVASAVNNQLSSKPGKYLHFNPEKDKFTDIKKMLSRITFLICPRGASKSTYLICEALQFGAIPVYISDDFIIPHNKPFAEYGVLIEHGEDIDEVLSAITPEQIKAKQSKIAGVYADCFTFLGCKQRMAHALLQEMNPGVVDEPAVKTTEPGKNKPALVATPVAKPSPAEPSPAPVSKENPGYFTPEKDINLSEFDKKEL